MEYPTAASAVDHREWPSAPFCVAKADPNCVAKADPNCVAKADPNCVAKADPNCSGQCYKTIIGLSRRLSSIVIRRPSHAGILSPSNSDGMHDFICVASCLLLC